MYQEIKVQWVAALRSGLFRQGDGLLKCTEPGGITKHCCLGVLCELAEQAGIVRTDHIAIDPDPAYGHTPPVIKTTYDGMGEFLPKSVTTWAGLDVGVWSDTPGDPCVVDDGAYRHLTYLNDAATPFDEIADLIDASL